MAQEHVVNFLFAVRDNAAVLARYNSRNLSQLLVHAKNDGFDFTAEDLAQVVGRLEASVILEKNKEAYDGSSRLWPRMWGCYHLEYVIRDVLNRHTSDEVRALIGKSREPGNGSRTSEVTSPRGSQLSTHSS